MADEAANRCQQGACEAANKKPNNLERKEADKWPMKPPTPKGTNIQGATLDRAAPAADHANTPRGGRSTAAHQHRRKKGGDA